MVFFQDLIRGFEQRKAERCNHTLIRYRPPGKPPRHQSAPVPSFIFCSPAMTGFSPKPVCPLIHFMIPHIERGFSERPGRATFSLELPRRGGIPPRQRPAGKHRPNMRGIPASKSGKFCYANRHGPRRNSQRLPRRFFLWKTVFDGGVSARGTQAGRPEWKWTKGHGK